MRKCKNRENITRPGGECIFWIVQTFSFLLSTPGRFTEAQTRKFFHTMRAQKSYYVSATAIIIENRNNGLRNRKLDFTQYSHVLLSLTLRKRPRRISTIFPNAKRRCSFHFGQSWWRRIQTLGMPEDHSQELDYFEVVGVFRTVAVAFG